jgi:hypothetical protein
MKAGGQWIERQRLMRFSSRWGGTVFSSGAFFAERTWAGSRCRATASGEPLFFPIMRFNHPHWRSPVAGCLAAYSALARFLKDFPLSPVFIQR